MIRFDFGEVGLVMIKLTYFVETDHRIVSSIVVQVRDAEPVPRPTPRILYRAVAWYFLAAGPCPVLMRYAHCIHAIYQTT